jgi:hypothetical protein
MPDADLLELCRQFHRLRAEAQALPIDEIEAFCFALRVRRQAASVVLRTPIATAAGRRAAASVAISMLEDGEYPWADPGGNSG